VHFGWVAALTALGGIGCVGEKGGSPRGVGHGGAGTDRSCSGSATTDEDGELVVVLEDRHDYSFTSSLEIETVPVRAASDLTFDWSGVTRDMLDHPFDPLASVDMIELMVWRYAADDLIRDIGSDSLDTSNLVALGQLPTQNARDAASLLEIRSPSGGTLEPEVLLEYVDPNVYPPEDHTYLVMVAEGTAFGHGTKMIALFDPDPEEENTEIHLDDDSTILHYTADLTSLDRVILPAGTTDVVLDWNDDEVLTTTAMGQPWFPTRITDVQIAHFQTWTPDDLQGKFLDLETVADELYTIHLSAGQSVNLSRLSDADGAPFAGIDAEGTWIAALKCGSCTNPAPLFLTILEPCSQ
jgi:hypothetical protein